MPAPRRIGYNVPRHAFDAADATRIAHLAEKGWKPRAIATALGISLRSAQRYQHAKVVTVTVAGWGALFLTFPDRAPSRVGPWLRGAA
jgi:hypothetical protein